MCYTDSFDTFYVFLTNLIYINHTGAAGVGKTALVSQFMTSEYMNTYDASLGTINLLWAVIYSQLYSVCVSSISLEYAYIY
jgi:GTPase SAR1 family protein